MAKQRPPKVPTFATDDVFDEPGEAWDGTDTKGQPSNARLAEGFVPASRPPAQWFNWLFWSIGMALDYLLAESIARWVRVPVVEGDGTTELWGSADLDLRCGVWVSNTSSSLGGLFMFGEPDSVTGKALAAVSIGGGAWTVPPEDVDASSPGTILGCCHDTTNGLVVAVATAGLVYTRSASTAPLGTWTQRNSAANHELRSVVHGLGASGTICLIAVGEDTSDDNGVIYSSTDGTTWTLRLENTDKPFRAVAVKPGSLWVAVGGGNAAESVAGVYTSTDGSTWTDRSATATGFGAGLLGIVYDAERDVFVAIGRSGVRGYSGDGQTWVLTTDTGVAWRANDPTAIACDGQGAIMVLVNGLTNTTAGGGWKVFLSTDAGVTFTDGALVFTGASETPTGLFWGGPWGWVIPCDMFPGTGVPAVYRCPQP